jgi:hypothetical protein
MLGDERIVDEDDGPPMCCEESDRTGIDPTAERANTPKLFRSRVPIILERLLNAST